ncbi:MAG: PadR family transcriptional regulator [Mycobacteriales bacterium]
MENLKGLGLFTDPSLLILSSLADRPKHGYAMNKDIEAFAGVVLQPATLYGAVARLAARGLIQAMPAEERRQPYRLTEHGATVLAAQLRTVQAVAAAGLARLATA